MKSAATLAGCVEPALRSHGFQREFNEAKTLDRLIALLREQLAPDELSQLLLGGACHTPQTAIALALEKTR